MSVRQELRELSVALHEATLRIGALLATMPEDDAPPAPEPQREPEREPERRNDPRDFIDRARDFADGRGPKQRR